SKGIPMARARPAFAASLASLIARSGHRQAAPESQTKKPAKQAASKQAAPAKKGPAASAKAHGRKTTATAHARSPVAKTSKTTAASKAGADSKKTAVHIASAAASFPLPRPRPDAKEPPAMVLASADSQPVITRPSLSAPVTTTTSTEDLAAVRRAFDLIHQGKISAVNEVKQTITDPAALKLIEWYYLRSSSSQAGYERYFAFVRSNPSWPSVGMLQKRGEGSLWDDKRDAATVLNYFFNSEPRTGKGRLAMARALLTQGDQAGAQRFVREAWRRDIFGADTEEQAIEMFGAMITTADHRARMHRMIFAGEEGAAMRSAKRLGAADQAVAKARFALNDKA